MSYTPRDAVMARRVYVPSSENPATQTNWSSVGTGSVTFFGLRRDSTGAQNAAVGWDVLLNAGTWTISMFHVKSTDVGIYTITIDGASLTSLGGSADTVDGYAASAANSKDDVTGIVLPTPGIKRVLLTLATKNASSTNYKGLLSALLFLRTA